MEPAAFRRYPRRLFAGDLASPTVSLTRTGGPNVRPRRLSVA